MQWLAAYSTAVQAAMDNAAAVDPGPARDAGQKVGSAVPADAAFDRGRKGDDDACRDVAGVLEIPLGEDEVAFQGLCLGEPGELFDALAGEGLVLALACLMHAWHSITDSGKEGVWS